MNPPNQSTLRQLKWLVAVLVLSNVALGLFGFSVLRKMDRQYSELIGHTVPLLNNLQTLTARSVEAMRGTGPNLLEVPAQARDDAAVRGRRAVLADRVLRVQVLKEIAGGGSENHEQALERTGQEFTTIAGTVIELAAAGNLVEAKTVRDQKLRPAFDHYLDAITHAADGIESISLQANQDYSETNGNMSHVILGVASWPVILVVGLLLFTAVFVLGLMVLFRGREMNDMP